QNPCSPLYIHLNENPSSILVSLVLSGGNYHSWSCSFCMALASKNKIGFLTSAIPIPTPDDPTYSSWERCNTLLMSWLINSISPSIMQSIIYLDRAIGVWNDL
ncbi:hypothetical protein glysoja_017455, partial [Glycine soja]